MSFVYPNCVSTVLYEGGRIRLHPQQQWHDDDPFVKARPEFFSDQPLVAAQSADYQSVERATRAPGEKRQVRRGRRGKPATDTGGESGVAGADGENDE